MFCERKCGFIIDMKCVKNFKAGIPIPLGIYNNDDSSDKNLIQLIDQLTIASYY